MPCHAITTFDYISWLSPITFDASLLRQMPPLFASSMPLLPPELSFFFADFAAAISFLCFATPLLHLLITFSSSLLERR
jgi:hypothetical protein